MTHIFLRLESYGSSRKACDVLHAPNLEGFLSEPLQNPREPLVEATSDSDLVSPDYPDPYGC